MNASDDESWGEYRKLIVKELEDRFSGQREIEVRLNHIERELAILATKASIYGVLSGTLAALVVLGLKFLEK